MLQLPNNPERAARLFAFKKALRELAGRSKGSQREAMAKLMRLANPRSQARLVLVASGRRTGSTLLCSRAAQQPGVGTEYELLNPIAFRTVERNTIEDVVGYVRGACSAHEICVVKIFPEHLNKLGLKWTEIVEAFPEAIWIQLYRADLLAQHASLLRARDTGSWIARKDGDPSSEVVQIHLDTDAFLSYRQEVLASDLEAFEAIGSTTQYTRVSYEELTTENSSWIAHVFCPLVGVPPLPARTDEFLKQGPSGGDSGADTFAHAATELRDAPEGDLTRHLFATSDGKS